MRRATALLGWSAVLMLVSAGALPAQTVFVEGGAFLGIERLSHTSTQPDSALLADLSGTVAGGLVGVGTFLSPQWSLEVDFALPSLLKRTTTTNQLPIVQPLAPTAVAGQPAAGVVVPYPPISIIQQVERDYRAPGAAILVGYHTSRRHRVEMGYLGGLMLLEERQHTLMQVFYVSQAPGIVLPPPWSNESTEFNYRAAAALGLDVDIALAAHLALVPQVRTDVFVGSLSVRPAVVLRWNF